MASFAPTPIFPPRAGASPPRAGGASEAIAIDDPEALELMSLFMRLSREGRRVLLGLTRSLGADPKLGSKG